MGNDGFSERKKGFEGLKGVFYLEDNDLERFQNELLGIALDVIRVMDESDIFYTLSGGSLLGAVRHNGFVPWDDDIDINIPRKDLEKLKEVFPKRLGDKYDLCCPEYGDGHGLSIVQIKKKDTVYRSYNELGKTVAGIGIDLFVLENVPNNIVVRGIHGVLCLAVGYCLSARYVFSLRKYLEPYMKQKDEVRQMFSMKILLGFLFSFLSIDKWTKLVKKVYSLCKNDESKYVAIPSGRKHYFGEMYLRKDVCRFREGIFCGRQIKIPYGAEAYLKRLYGDGYMEIPRYEEREKHPVFELRY